MEIIKQVRKLCGINQSEFSDRLGIVRSNYCNIENGKFIPNQIENITNKAKIILIPELDKLIKQKELEIIELKKLYEELKL